MVLLLDVNGDGLREGKTISVRKRCGCGKRGRTQEGRKEIMCRRDIRKRQKGVELRGLEWSGVEWRG